MADTALNTETQYRANGVGTVVTAVNAARDVRTLSVLVVTGRADGSDVVRPSALERELRRLGCCDDVLRDVAAIDLALSRSQYTLALVDSGAQQFSASVEDIQESTAPQFFPVVIYCASSQVHLVPDAGPWDDVHITTDSAGLLATKCMMWEGIRGLHHTVAGQRYGLELFHERHDEESRAAEQLFARLAHPGCLRGENLRYIHTAKSIFNGDLLLATPTGVGGVRILMGDFTGHGLVAAVGASPAAEIFYGMTKKGFSLGEVAREINEKLRRILPLGRFLAVAMLELDARHTELAVWNGGLPEILVPEASSGAIKILHVAQHLPLAVVDAEQMDLSAAYYGCLPGDHIYPYSDGVLEAENPYGQRFGTKRIDQCLRAAIPGESAFDALVGAVNEFRAGRSQTDDITLLEITCDPSLIETMAHERDALGRAVPARRWEVSLELDALALRTADPLPLLTPLLLGYQGLAKHWSHIFTVLSELYSNALDHGVPRLDSALKRAAVGFARYYDERGERLANLHRGSVIIRALHGPLSPVGGELELEFTDSGPGFDWRAVLACPASDATVYAGRGITLLKGLCYRLEFFESGNRVRAVCRW
jgi:anti-sigma regulatory factor (Ser/Thr protein kinase)